MIYETDLYGQALDKLSEIYAVGSQPVAPGAHRHPDAESTNGLDPITIISQAQSILDRAQTQPVAQAERTRILQLAEGLFQSIRMQLSMELYQAEGVERAGNLDTLDAPVTNGPWLAKQLREIGLRPTAMEQIKAIDALLSWTNPGPGGFYDDLGDIARPSRLVRGPGSVEDPEFRKSAMIGHRFPMPADMPLAWKRWAEALYEAPLKMHYDSLDRDARYRVRVIYAGDSPKVKIRMECEGNLGTDPTRFLE